MVVMLIMSIILAAMAPVMTTRARKMEEDRLSSTIWQWADNDTDIYFGYNPDELDVSDTQKVMIGQNTALGTDLARLIINTSDDLPDYIRFNKDATTYGRLYMNDTSLTLGSGQGSGGGAQSTSIGIGALAENTGASNTAVGYNSMLKNQTGAGNVAIGTDTMSSSIYNENGNYNVAVGVSALKNTTGHSGSTNIASYNTAIGYEALMNNINGQWTTAVGARALYSFRRAGAMADINRAVDSGNVAVGAYSSYSDTSGEDNVAVGYKALYSNRGGDNNTSLGSFSLASANGSANTAIGYQAMQHAGGGNNVAIGINALRNTGITNDSPTGNINQQSNIAIGTDSMRGGGTLRSNIAIGEEALQNVESASYNIAIGQGSMNPMSGSVGRGGTSSHNTALGYRAAGNLNTGTYNVAIGANSMGTLKNAGSDNIAIGQYTFTSSLGSNNIAIGNHACMSVTGSNYICIGEKSGPSSGWSSSPEHIYIGSKSRFNSGAAVLEVHNIDDTMTSSGAPYGGMNGSGVVINGTLLVNGPIMSRFVHTGNSEVNELGILEVTDGGIGQRVRPTNTSFGDFLHSHPLYDYSMDKSWRSDRRLKYVGKEFTSGLDKIRQLKVFNYTFKKDEKKTPHVGVIAQDLQKVFPDAVKKGTDGFLQIRFEDMFYAVINAIKELDSRVTALEKENAELKKMLKQVQHDTTLQEARLKSLEAQLK